MRTARKLTLLAILAITATALAAPLAFAQVEPELHNQAPRMLVAQEIHAGADIACPAVTPTPPPSPGPLVTAGGCRGHYTADNVVLSAHLSAGGTEVVISSCNVEFDVRGDSAGEGYVAHQEFTQGTSGTCARKACGQVTPSTSEGRAFTVYGQETEVAGQGPREAAVVLFCTEDLVNPVPSHCEVIAPITQGSTHRYTVTANDVSGHGTAFPHCELTGTFNQEAALQTTGEGQLEQNVEIRHT
ncbi:MAG TPA: hypothetical protein VEX36_08020 [Thermoleophilaceae bacterium]|nr:hypothetical protein [Thermoleophilaceae bacterium]